MTTTSTVAAVTADVSQPRVRRVLNVTRLHFVNRWNLIYLPWMILGFIFLINYLIWWIVAAANGKEVQFGMSNGTQYSGATFYIFVYMLVIAIQAITLTFSFALSLSVTRRDYYLGTSLTFALLCLMYGGGMTLLSFIEDATGGWGLGGHMFHSVYVGDGAWWSRLFVYSVGLAFFIFLGALYGAMYMRWRLNGTVALSALLALLVLGGVALITFTANWVAVGAWFLSSGPVGVAAWLLVPTTIAAIAGFYILRRATPKG